VTVSDPTQRDAAASLPALLRERQVAAILNLDGRTIRRMRKRGELPGVVIGRSVRYRAADVASLIARGLDLPPERATTRRASRAEANPLTELGLDSSGRRTR
jgi:excisionase family DNA binding protein